MPPDEYKKALAKALSDLRGKVSQRDVLTAEIAGLKETVRVLSSRTELTPVEQTEVAQLIAWVDSATPKLTDAIRSLLTRIYPNTITAIEVRNELEDSFNYDDSNISLSACHAALKRMLADKEVENGPMRNGKVTYRRILKLSPDSSINLANLSGKLRVQLRRLQNEPFTPGELKRRLEEQLGKKPK